MKRLFVVLTAIALVGAFTATAMAADWNFYGNSRLTTFYEGYSKETAKAGGTDSLSYLTWQQQGNSRIGANVKVTDNFVGRFEYGFAADNVSGRILWAEYDFGGFKMGLGQTYTPISWWVGGQVWGSDYGMTGLGAPYGGRKDQMRFTVGGFQLALIESPTDSTKDQMLPKIEARYAMPIGAMRLGLFGGYNTQKDAAEEDINSLIAGLGFNGSFGAFWFNSALTYGSNSQNAGWAVGGNVGTADDATTSLAFALALGMSASEVMAFEGGLGYWTDEGDALGDDPDTQMTVYVNMTYTIAPGFFVVPEVGMIDYMDNAAGAEEGNLTYAGAKWQMNF